MIFHPKPGERVRVHYAKAAADRMPFHGRTGVVRIVAKGPGPRNVGVEIDGRIVVIPRGNLVAEEMASGSSEAGTTPNESVAAE